MFMHTCSGPHLTPPEYLQTRAKRCCSHLYLRHNRLTRVRGASPRTYAATAGTDHRQASAYASRSTRHLSPPYAAPAAPLPALGRVPKSLREIDNGKILGFGADLAQDHPVSSKFMTILARLWLEDNAH